MAALNKPSDIAREALRQLAARRIEPTPDNYRQLYNQIAGHVSDDASDGAEQAFGRIAADFPRASPALARVADALGAAATAQNWDSFREELLGFAKASHAPTPSGWSALIRDLLRQLETRHAGLTRARKQDALDKLLARTADESDVLLPRLQTLVRSWTDTTVSTPTPDVAATPEPHDVTPRVASPLEDCVWQLRDVLAQALELGLAPQLSHTPKLAAQAQELARNARAARDATAFDALAGALKQFLLQIELSGGPAQLEQGLLRLLKLLIDNICELAADDQWLRGQVAVVLDIISRPLDAALIEDAEKSLKQVILKQGVLKSSLTEAKTTFKHLVTGFVEQLGDFSASTGEYHDKIEKLADRIGATEDVNELGAILDEVARETRVVQAATVRSRTELEQARKRVEAAEQKIRQLEADLESASEKVRVDQLTGMLNRRGLDGAFEQALAQAEGTGKPLAAALLDIDNFKQLNDAHGHQAGDDALVHVAKVIKESVRPNDQVARYGGEEFLVLLPDSNLDDAVALMTRVQRNLTRAFFLHDHQRLLITFSAGVAIRSERDTSEAIIARADKALYQAKRAGKNRVVAAQ